MRDLNHRGTEDTEHRKESSVISVSLWFSMRFELLPLELAEDFLGQLLDEGLDVGVGGGLRLGGC